MTQTWGQTEPLVKEKGREEKKLEKENIGSVEEKKNGDVTDLYTIFISLALGAYPA